MRGSFLVVPCLLVGTLLNPPSNALACPSGLPRADTGGPTMESLQAALDSLLQAVKAGDAQGLLAQLSGKGVAFGADGHIIPWSDLAADLSKKGGFYCIFFDSSCLKREPENESYDSIQEILAGSDAQQLKTALVQRGGNGAVSFSVSTIPKSAFWMVTYRFEGGQWKISSMLTLAKLPRYGSGEAAPQPSAGAQDKDLAALEATGWRLVALLKDGNPEDLPKLCWRKGVTIGLDRTTLSASKLAEMIASKDWFYCAYFDSGCYSRSDKEFVERYSYRDLLLKASSVRLNAITRTRPGYNKSGVITLEIAGGPAKEQLERQGYSFVFTLDEGAWKIKSLEGDPDFVF